MPTDLQFYVEIPHRDWFLKEDIQQAFITTLAAMNMGIVITDTAGRRDCAHMYLTVPKALFVMLAIVCTQVIIQDVLGLNE